MMLSQLGVGVDMDNLSQPCMNWAEHIFVEAMEMKWTERDELRKAKEEREAAEILCPEGRKLYERMEKMMKVRKVKSKARATWRKIAAKGPSNICIDPDEVRIDAQFWGITQLVPWGCKEREPRRI
jgi:hypothetical protein